MDTNQTILPPPWNKRYIIARAFIILIFLCAAIYFAFLVLFPSQSFQFDFKNPQASKNSLLDPRSPNGDSLGKGKIAKDTPLFIDASFINGDYSYLQTTFTPEKKSETPEGSIELQKSYRAFFYPTGDPITDNPLQSHTLFVINNTYYEQKNDMLFPFVSENAYLSQYSPQQALPETQEFLQDKTISEDWLGFRNSSLLSFADGVFLVDGSEVRPIGDATIFESLGYNWEDVLPASEEEIGIYQKGKIVLMGNIHPNNTIFYDQDYQKYFIIENQQKREIQNETYLQELLSYTHPIVASEKTLDIKQQCNLNISGIFSKQYQCSIPLEIFKNAPGNTYRISATFNNSVEIQNAETILASNIDMYNFKLSLSQIKRRILSHYGYAQ